MEKNKDLIYLGGYETEAEYRADKARMNYSRLADFDKKTPRAWKKKYIDDIKDEEVIDELRLGSAMDLAVLGEPGEFKSKVYVSSVDKVPSPNNLKFANELDSMWHLFEDGSLNFEEVTQAAYTQAGILSPKYPKYIESFEGSDTEQYFTDMIAGRGKLVCSTQEFNNITKTSGILVNHPNSKWIFDMEGINQLKVAYEYQGVEYRIMLDRVCIDHTNKRIWPFDLKTSFSPPMFDKSFFDFRYYIQQGMYRKGVEAWRDNNYPDYEVMNFQFLVIDVMGLNDPLIWNFEYINGNEWYGFKRFGRDKRGILDLAKDLAWHFESDIWSTTRENYFNSGKINFII